MKKCANKIFGLLIKTEGLLLATLCCIAFNSASGQKTFSLPVTPPIIFKDFVGTCQGGPQTPHLYDIVGWDRNDISWNRLQPSQGEWKQEELEKWGKKILEMKAMGVKFLPILCYNASWSWDRSERTYVSGNQRFHVKPLENGKYLVEKFRHTQDDKWALEESKEVTANDHWPLSIEHQADWENYVRRTVEFFRKAPYNIEYFQIWNETYPTSGFWAYGDVDTYMSRVHIPASRIIRQLGGKVVYGGWPCCGSIQDYVAMLDRNKAWNTIDILDIHYFPISAFEYLYKAATDRGFKSIGIWQTEFAFSKDPAFIGNNFPRFLSWCLEHNWSYADRYKLFFFCATTPDDPKSYGYDRALVQGKELSHHGLSLKTLNNVFSSGKVSLYIGVKTKPLLNNEINEGKSSLESFKVGDKKIIIAIHLVQNNDARIFTDWNGKMESIHLDFDNPTIAVTLQKLKPNQVATVDRVDISGQHQPLEVKKTTTREVTFEVPIRDKTDSLAHQWFNKTNVLTFLVEVTLK